MKKVKIAAMISLLLICSYVKAQPGGAGHVPPHERSEMVESMKVAFFTQRLDLSVDEAKVFWPVYNQYQTELNTLRDNRRSEIKSYLKNDQELSDKDYEKFADGEIEFREQELAIVKKYHNQLKTVISPKKLAQLYKAENDFKRELLRQIQDKNRKSGGRSSSGKPKRD